MTDELEQMRPNQRHALNKALSALEAFAAIWAAEISLGAMSARIAAVPNEAERAKRIAAMIEQGFIEGAYRHYLDHKDKCDELEAARATAEQPVPKGWITQDGATFTLEAAAERGKTPQALAYAAVSRALGGIEKICRNHGYNYAEILHDWLEAKLSVTPSDHSAWFTVTSGAAASLEDAAVCMQDPDAKHSAEGAAAFTRKRIKELLSALKSQQDAAIESKPAEQSADAKDAARYRWLRDSSDVPNGWAPMVFNCEAGGRLSWGNGLVGEELDAVLDPLVDAAIESQSGDGS